MRHARSGKKLGRDSAHRKALYSNLAGALITHGRIETTEAKAKAVKPFAEKMITLGKRGDLHARRLAMAQLRSNDVVHKLFSDVAPRFAERPGGYTRVVKLGPRQGDAAQMALLELVDFDSARSDSKSTCSLASGIPQERNPAADPRLRRGTSLKAPLSRSQLPRLRRRQRRSGLGCPRAHDHRGRRSRSPSSRRRGAWSTVIGAALDRRRRRRGSSFAGRSGVGRPSASRRSSDGPPSSSAR